MFEIRERPEQVERALLVGVFRNRSEEAGARALLAELGELVGTLGIGVVESLAVRAPKSNARYLMGSGKAAEIMDHAKEKDCDCIVFDNDLSPAQQRAWEDESGLPVIDREEVILDIFARRASTKEARLQVDLARMQYALPRMARMWKHLDRQRGGAGGGKGGAAAARGEGEKQIEVDKRLARERIAKVRSELEEVRRIRQTQRKERESNEVPVVAIVGYTNAGKSSLLNRLTGAEVLAEDKLFATLDTTTRRFVLPDNQEVLLVDTVGFVRNLPHRLVEAFMATLEEAVVADILIHVLDGSSEECQVLHDTTIKVLGELGAAGKPIVLAINKCDLLDARGRADLRQRHPEGILVSVQTGEGLDTMIGRLHDLLRDRVRRHTFRIPAAEGGMLAKLYQEAKVIDLEYDDADALVTAVVSPRLAHQFARFLTSGAQPGMGSSAS